MLLSIAILVILLGFLVRTKYVNLSMHNTSLNGGEKERKVKYVSAALIWIGSALLSFEILSYFEGVLEPEIYIVLNVVIFCILFIAIVFFIMKLNALEHAKSRYRKCILFGSIGGGVLIVGTLLVSLRQPDIIITKDNIQINAIFPYEFKLSEIDSIWVGHKKINVEKKLSGFNFQNFYRGKFKTENSDKIYRLYINNQFDFNLYIALKNNEVIVYNNSNPEKIRLLLSFLKSEK